MTTQNVNTLKIMLIIALLFSVSAVADAWSGNDEIAPGNNSVRPINVGSGSQTKDGILFTRGLYAMGQSTFSSGVFNPPSNLVLTVRGGSIGASQYCDDLGRNCRPINASGTPGPVGPKGTSTVPVGAIAAFRSTSCPANLGWQPLDNNAGPGLYIVGASPRGSIGTVVGTRLSNLANRPTGAHTHLVLGSDNPNNVSFTRTDGNSEQGNDGTTVTYVTPGYPAILGGDISSSNTSLVPGTNAPYVQLLYCRKVS